MFDKVVDIIVENLNVNKEDITPSSRFIEDLGADSLDAVELFMAFSDEFGIKIENEEFNRFKTVQDILDEIEKNK